MIVSAPDSVQRRFDQSHLGRVYHCFLRCSGGLLGGSRAGLESWKNFVQPHWISTYPCRFNKTWPYQKWKLSANFLSALIRHGINLHVVSVIRTKMDFIDPAGVIERKRLGRDFGIARIRLDFGLRNGLATAFWMGRICSRKLWTKVRLFQNSR